MKIASSFFQATLFSFAIGPLSTAPSFADSLCEKTELIQVIQEIKAKKSKPLILERCDGKGYLSTHRFFSQSLGLPEATIVVWDFNDLRFLPFTLAHSHILIISPDPIREKNRIAAVKKVAKTMKITVHGLFIKEATTELLQPYETELFKLVKETNGKLIEINSSRSEKKETHLIENRKSEHHRSF